MSRIKIRFSAVRAANAELSKTAKRLDRLADDLELLRKRLDPEILARHQIDAGLISCKTTASAAYATMKKLHDAVDGGLEKYQTAESRLNGSAPDNSKV